MVSVSVELAGHTLATPLVAAAGTVGSVVDFAETVDFSRYGAAVAKSVSPDPWAGRPAPRIAPVGGGMLNGIGIQNPGVDVWSDTFAEPLLSVPTDVWGSVVGHEPDEFALVAERFDDLAAISAIEVNLSCPNLDGMPFALDPSASRRVVEAVRAVTDKPIGAKLSPDAHPIAAVADAVMGAGADWLVVGNTARGAAIDVDTRRPLTSGLIAGYSGAPLRPITVRCVLEVSAALPDAPIVACGGVSGAEHVIEYLLAGATAVGIGSAHFATPRIATRILKDLERYLERNHLVGPSELIGAYEPWT
jgi:dihydroorotate dehydrogenase (NAD+) catalytic subunit